MEHSRRTLVGELLEDRRMLAASVSGSVWSDNNSDGVLDGNEPALVDQTVYIDQNDDGAFQSGQSTFQTTGAPRTIPDNGFIFDPLEVTGLAGTVVDVNVRINITHTFVGDLSIAVRSPQGTQALLVDSLNNSGDNLTDTLIDDEAIATINTGTAPYTGSFQPTGGPSLSAFDGETPNGTWELIVVDNASTDVGTLDDWSIEFTMSGAEPSQTTDASGDYTFDNLAAGSYVVRHVTDTGYDATFPAGDGAHRLTLADNDAPTGINFGVAPHPAAMEGVVWHDLNANGTRDGGEPGLAGFVVFIDEDGDDLLDPSETFVTTVDDDSGTPGVDERGAYQFPGLLPGFYEVRHVLPTGAVPEWVSTFPSGSGHSVSLTAGETSSNLDFGNQQQANLGGKIFRDADGDGIFNSGAGDSLLSGRTVFLDANDDGLLDPEETSTDTAGDGTYIFENLTPAEYVLRSIVPIDEVQTTPGGDFARRITANAGEAIDMLDFGHRPAEVFGLVFKDINRDGIQDGAEALLESFVVTLDENDDGQNLITTASRADGTYAFAGVSPGDHRVSIDEPATFLQSFPPGDGTHAVTITAGVPVADPLKFGVYELPDLSPQLVAATPEAPGATTSVDYETVRSLTGDFAPNELWDEEVWLTDDGVVDGLGFERLAATNSYAAAGLRNVSVTLPTIAASPSEANNEVTAEMVLAGMTFVVRVDPADVVLETDNDNNEASGLVLWEFADLVVTTTDGPRVDVEFQSGTDAPTRTLHLPDSLTYAVLNAGAVNIPASDAWVEQVWLGADADVHLADDADEGRWHKLVASGNDIAGTTGPLAAGNSTLRVVDVPVALQTIELPDGVEAADLQWIILVDWPDSGGLPVAPEASSPGDVLESHEANGLGTNNLYLEPAFRRIRRELFTDFNGSALSPFNYDMSADGRLMVLRANVEPFGFETRILLHDRDADGDGLFDESEPGAVTTIAIDEALGGGAPDHFVMHGNEGELDISPNGQFVVFTSDATNLTSTDDGLGQDDVFRYDVQTGEIVRVTVRGDGASFLGDGARHPRVSNLGDVVFTTSANNLVPGYFRFGDSANPYAGDIGFTDDTFYFDGELQTLHRVPLGQDWAGRFDEVAAGPAPTELNPAVLFGDGIRADFKFFPSGNDDTAFVGETVTYSLELRSTSGPVEGVSVNVPLLPGLNITSAFGSGSGSGYDEASGIWDVGDLAGSEFLTITGVVDEPASPEDFPGVFETAAFIPGINEPMQLRLRVLRNFQPTTEQPSISADGQTVVMVGVGNGGQTAERIYRYRLGDDLAEIAYESPSAFFREVQVTDNGNAVVVTSDKALSPADANAPFEDVYLVELGGGAAELVSRASDGSPSSSSSSHPAASSDGKFVAFNSQIIPNDLTGGAQGTVVARDRVGGGLTRITAELVSMDVIGTAATPVVSGGGVWVAYSTPNRLLTEDVDFHDNVYFVYMPPVVTGEISGTVFQDLNKNATPQAVRDPGEPGLAGVQVSLEIIDGNATAPEPVTTDANGFFTFDDVIADANYRVTIETPDGLIETFPGDRNNSGSYAVRINGTGGTGDAIRDDGTGGGGEMFPAPLFGLFPPPDLTVHDFQQSAVEFGEQTTVTWRTQNLGPGILLDDDPSTGADETDRWKERLFLVGSGGFELQITDVGGANELSWAGSGGLTDLRTFTFTMPALGETASAIGSGVVTPQMAADGLQLEVRLDEDDTLEEIDEDNNLDESAVTWKLPDLRVVNLEFPPLAFDQVLDDLTYTVRNDGDAATDTGFAGQGAATWIEQVWIGTDTDVLAASNPAGGVWHHQVGAFPRTDADGPLAPGASAMRTVTPDLTGVSLPPEISLDQVRWIVLLDRPDGSADADANSAAIVETHDVADTPNPNVDGDPANAFEFLASRIDLSPLQLEVVNGDFGYNGAENRFEASGEIEFGFDPGEGNTFVPLITLNGLVWFNEDTIHAEGTAEAEIGGITAPLLDGTFEISIGSAATSLLNEALDALESDFTIAGVEVSFSDLAFVIPSGGSISDGRIELQGTLTLPDELGGIELAVNDNNKVLISTSGVDITGGLISFPDVEVNLFGLLEISATDMSVEFATNPTTLKLQGEFSIPTLYNVTADLTGDNFIQMTESGVDFVGTISAEDVVIVPETWAINKASLFIDTINDEVIALGEATIPTGIVIVAGIGILQGELNFVELGVDDLNKPIGTTGAFLQRIVGRIDNIAEADPDPIAFGGDVRVTAGPEITISLPSWAGGDFTGSVADLLVTGAIDANHLEASGTLDIIGGVVTGTAAAELNWQNGFLKAEGSLEALGGLITYEGSFHADSKLNVTMQAGATVVIPDEIPVFGGETLGSGNVYFQYRNDATSFNDFVAGWGTVTLPLIGDVTRGMRLRFDGDFDILGADEIPSASSAPLYYQGSGDDKIVLGNVPETSPAFAVSAGKPWLLLSAEWENNNSGVTVEVIDPSGTVFTETDIAADADMAIAGALSDMTQRAVVVNAPAAGDWMIRVVDNSGLGLVDFAALTGNVVPTVALTSADADADPAAGSAVMIDYAAFDADSAAEVALYFDTDRTGYDGILIDGTLTEADGASTYAWDTTDVPTGDYWVYMVADDGTNAPVASDYGLGRIRITRPHAPESPSDLTAALVGDDDAQLSWSPVTGANNYFLHLTDDAAGEFYQQTISVDGIATSKLLTSLIPGETYRFAVQSVDPVGRLSPLSDPVVFVAGREATVSPTGDQWEAFAPPSQTYNASFALGAGDVATLVKGPVGATLTDGNFSWNVPADATGFHEVVVNITLASGDVVQHRRILHAANAPAFADFDDNQQVDGHDFLAWQRGLGTPAPNALKSDGDADNDLDVDGDDLSVWETQFGEVLPAASSHAVASAAAYAATPLPPYVATLQAELVDLAIAADLDDSTLRSTTRRRNNRVPPRRNFGVEQLPVFEVADDESRSGRRRIRAEFDRVYSDLGDATSQPREIDADLEVIWNREEKG
ncbi:SdrD B-like domain-containing protein [Pirellulales bacterium]|nr:SdrD B-like domain-containing protein [Pirellulales bacterium]